MDLKMMGKIIGAALLLETALLLLPVCCALVHGEPISPFVITMIIGGGLGGLLVRYKRDRIGLVTRESFMSTGLSWVVLSLVGMIPFMIEGALTHPIDAFFETVSGFTTTGASVITDLESLSKSLRMWRCELHWIGGMGILVFMASIMSFAGGSQMKLVKAESSGPVVSKLMPSAGGTARALYGLYTLLSFITFMILIFTGMPAYDSLCLMFSAAGTGGFGVLADSCASYTMLQQAVLNFCTLFFGVSFTVYFLISIGKGREALKSEELRAYIGIYLCSVLAITLMLFFKSERYGHDLLMCLHQAAFGAGTVITTTGFAIDDLNYWPVFAQFVIVMLMLVGSCAGSTGGGLKVSRIVVMVKSFFREVTRALRPDQVKKIHMDGKPLDETIVTSVGTYCFISAVIIVISVLIVALDSKTWDSTITAVLASFGNVGPGIGENGTFGSYAGYSLLSKVTLSIDMLLGRLEIYPILALFMRKNWSKF